MGGTGNFAGGGRTAGHSGGQFVQKQAPHAGSYRNSTNNDDFI